MVITHKFRLKSKNLRHLTRMAKAVNFVWNYVNDTSIQYLDKKSKWLSGYDLTKLTAGCSKELGIPARAIQLVALTYALSRKTSRKRKLQWRSAKRSLSWIPIYRDIISINGDSFKFNGLQFKFWKSRDIEGDIKTGSLIQDATGRWFLTLSCQVAEPQHKSDGESVGIDLGLKTVATLSDGVKYSRDSITNKWAIKLAKAQRARKRRMTTSIHQKIKNIRKDWNHKVTTNIVRQYSQIAIGDVSSSKLTKTRMAKSVNDASWFQFKSMLEYKARRFGVDYKEINEKFSSVTCSVCLQKTGPSGLSALGVREWQCSCGAHHDRDVNAAKNILRFRHESPIKGANKHEVSTPKDTMLNLNPL